MKHLMQMMIHEAKEGCPSGVAPSGIYMRRA